MLTDITTTNMTGSTLTPLTLTRKIIETNTTTTEPDFENGTENSYQGNPAYVFAAMPTNTTTAMTGSTLTSPSFGVTNTTPSLTPSSTTMSTNIGSGLLTTPEPDLQNWTEGPIVDTAQRSPANDSQNTKCRNRQVL